MLFACYHTLIANSTKNRENVLDYTFCYSPEMYKPNSVMVILKFISSAKAERFREVIGCIRIVFDFSTMVIVFKCIFLVPIFINVVAKLKLYLQHIAIISILKVLVSSQKSFDNILTNRIMIKVLYIKTL